MSLPLPPTDPLRDAKLKALGEFAAGAGHEINNPVATISGYVQQLMRDETDPDRIQMLLTIGAQAHRIRDMIGDAMLFARPPQPRPQPQNLRQVAEEVVAKFEEEAKSRGCTVEISPGEELPILADPTQVRVLLSALVRNALEASQANGRIVLEGGQFVDGRGAFARLTIADDGRGLSPDELEHLFDPFYSGRQAGRGLGFGLPKAWRIATLHHADLKVASPEGRGALFTLIWPLET